MSTRDIGSTSLVKISPVLGAAFAASLIPAYLTPLPTEYHFEPASFPSATRLGPLNLTERDIGAVVEPAQGSAWLSSDAWFVPVRSSIYELLSLPDNWDSYGAVAVKPEFAASAAGLLQSIMDQDTPYPAVVPTAPGGVQIEWHANGIDLEIEIHSTSKITVFFEDLRTGISWEDELSSNIQKLSSVVAMISGQSDRA